MRFVAASPRRSTARGWLCLSVLAWIGAVVVRVTIVPVPGGRRQSEVAAA